MRRRLATVLFASALTGAGSDAATAARPGRVDGLVYSVYVDGRKLDARGASAIERRGVTYVNLVRAIKAFDGLLTFGRNGRLRVTIDGQTLDFNVGSSVASFGGAPVRLRGAPFVLAGDTYVPLVPVAMLASASLAVDARKHRATLVLGEGDGFPQAATPMPDASDADVVPSLSQALTLVPTLAVDGHALHARVELVNRTAKPYAIDIVGPVPVTFVISRDGSEVWNSAAAANAAAAGVVPKLVVPASGTRAFDATWTGVATAGSGHYSLRVRLMTLIPTETSPVSTDYVAPK